MNRRRAKSLISELEKELREDPSGADTVKRQFWMDKVQGYARQIFGESTKHIALPMYDTYYVGWRPFDKLNAQQTAELREKLFEMFKVYQTFIGNQVFQKRNILSDDNNGTLASWVLAVIVSVGTIAFTLGQRSTDVKNFELAQENKELRRQLLFFKDQNHYKTTDHNQSGRANKP